MIGLHLGECLSTLKDFEPNSIDALVTDPPAGISFMGKEWDSDKGGSKQWIAWMTEVMAECLRVLKPGAHGLVWAIPRTSHWTATALENAGFEIRDVVTHLFGTGFPKSLDISKAIDKAAGAEREIGQTIGELNGRNIENHKKEHHILAQVNGWDKATSSPSTDLAKQWQGWGTALKPASEHWILVRKPCSEKTVAKNVEKWGTGGINIDGCRIGISDTDPNHRKPSVPFTGRYFDIADGKSNGRPTENLSSQGRFPANLVLDEVAAEMLDEQSVANGIHSAGKVRNPGESNQELANSMFLGDKGSPNNGVRFDDKTVGASRFFYIAKASKSERGDGNNHPTVKSLKLMRYLCRLITPPNGLVLDPFMGSGSTGIAAKEEGFRFVGIEQSHEYLEIAKGRLA